MAEPRRIQLRRTKGWRLPEGAVVVSRQSKLWGNPFKIGALVEDPESGRIPPQPQLGGMAPGEQGVGNLGGGPDGTYIFEVRFILSAADAVALFIRWAAHVRDQETGLWFKDLARNDLAGRDLACWCGPNAACHADVLLELANR